MRPWWPAELNRQFYLLGSNSSARRAASAACADPVLEADLCTSTSGGVEGPAEPEGPTPAVIHTDTYNKHSSMS